MFNLNGQKMRRLKDVKIRTEHKVLRDTINRLGQRPDILMRGEEMYWDGFSVRTPNGRRTQLSEYAAGQMQRMARDGEWGDLQEVILDGPLYWAICDALITWPDERKITLQKLAEYNFILRSVSTAAR